METSPCGLCFSLPLLCKKIVECNCERDSTETHRTQEQVVPRYSLETIIIILIILWLLGAFVVPFAGGLIHLLLVIVLVVLIVRLLNGRRGL